MPKVRVVCAFGSAGLRMGGMIYESTMGFVGSNKRRRPRKPPVHMRCPAPQIGNIPRKIVVPNEVRDQIHVNTRANLAGWQFSPVKAHYLSAVSKREWVLRQQDIRMAPYKTRADAFAPGVTKDVAEFDHLRTGGKERRLQSEGLDALEQLLLSEAEPLVSTWVNPLKCNSQLHSALGRDGKAWCAVFALPDSGGSP